jgi:hypothetical protein
MGKPASTRGRYLLCAEVTTATHDELLAIAQEEETAVAAIVRRAIQKLLADANRTPTAA